MEIELDDDEAYIYDQLKKLPSQFQTAFALLVAERFIISLGAYTPDYWHESAAQTINCAWDCLEEAIDADESFNVSVAKLKAAGIGSNENPVITHIMKVVDLAVDCQSDLADLDKFMAELHHLMSVVSVTMRDVERVDESVGGEQDYQLAVCNLLVSIHAGELKLGQEDIKSQLPVPTTTLFG